jgi:hypothetical protein
MRHPEEDVMCNHIPRCPTTQDSDCNTAHVVVDRSDQGWCQLCNGVILFDDGHYLTPDGHDHAISA